MGRGGVDGGLEAGGGGRWRRHLESKRAIRFLDLFLCCFPPNTKNLVVVVAVHLGLGCSSAPLQRSQARSQEGQPCMRMSGDTTIEPRN